MTRTVLDESVQSFLDDAAAQAGTSPEEVLAAVLHVGLRDLQRFVQGMRPDTKELFAQLDYGLRTRNPGLHYVPRQSYLGYRREAASTTGAGERSQVFVSVLRNTTTLDAVLPLDPATLTSIPSVRNLTGVGHHGVGDTRVTISDTAQLHQFFADFDFWLRPSPRPLDHDTAPTADRQPHRSASTSC